MRPQDANGEARLTDEGITRLFRDYAAAVYHVGLGILHDSDQAADVVGEVFGRLVCSRNPTNPTKGYFTTAARNEALHILSRSQRLGKFATMLRSIAEDHHPSSEVEIERNEQSYILRQLMRRLPDRCRVVNELIVEGLTQAEIADRLQISPDAVQKQASRGYRLLVKMAAQLNVRLLDGHVPKSGRGGRRRLVG